MRAERRRIYEFLALASDEARELESWDLTKPGIPAEQSKGFFRKGVSGDWERYFHADARRWFKEEAGDLLVELQYASDDAW